MGKIKKKEKRRIKNIEQWAYPPDGYLNLIPYQVEEKIVLYVLVFW
jgi:hypothetical protein